MAPSVVPTFLSIVGDLIPAGRTCILRLWSHDKVATASKVVLVGGALLCHQSLGLQHLPTVGWV